MTAITRNISAKLQKAIQKRAGADGLSLDGTAPGMLEETEQRDRRELHHDLDHLAGTWSDEEVEFFDAALAEQRHIDPELWS